MLLLDRIAPRDTSRSWARSRRFARCLLAASQRPSDWVGVTDEPGLNHSITAGLSAVEFQNRRSVLPLMGKTARELCGKLPTATPSLGFNLIPFAGLGTSWPLSKVALAPKVSQYREP